MKEKKQKLMPALFIGHGSPMNLLGENRFKKELETLATSFEKPKAIVVLSAHWQAQELSVSASNEPVQLYDFYGFPKALYSVEYRPKGSESLAKRISKLAGAKLDNLQGLDHGAWGVVSPLYPKADIPVLQVSLVHSQKAEFYYELGKTLKVLRKEDVLVIASGNIVHNLHFWQAKQEAFSWAIAFDAYVKKAVKNNDVKALLEFENMGIEASLSHPTTEHFLPLLSIMGMLDKDDEVSFFHELVSEGALSMTSFKIAQR